MKLLTITNHINKLVVYPFAIKTLEDDKWKGESFNMKGLVDYLEKDKVDYMFFTQGSDPVIVSENYEVRLTNPPCANIDMIIVALDNEFTANFLTPDGYVASGQQDAFGKHFKSKEEGVWDGVVAGSYWLSQLVEIISVLPSERKAKVLANLPIRLSIKTGAF